MAAEESAVRPLASTEEQNDLLGRRQVHAAPLPKLHPLRLPRTKDGRTEGTEFPNAHRRRKLISPRHPVPARQRISDLVRGAKVSAEEDVLKDVAYGWSLA